MGTHTFLRTHPCIYTCTYIIHIHMYKYALTYTCIYIFIYMQVQGTPPPAPHQGQVVTRILKETSHPPRKISQSVCRCWIYVCGLCVYVRMCVYIQIITRSRGLGSCEKQGSHPPRKISQSVCTCWIYVCGICVYVRMCVYIQIITRSRGLGSSERRASHKPRKYCFLRSESWSGCMQPFLSFTAWAWFWSNLFEFRTFVFRIWSKGLRT
jgi:hypothetical protein